MGDRIETGTFCVAATLTKGNLLIKGFDPSLIKTELDLLKKTGAKIKTIKDEIHIKGPQKIKKIRTWLQKNMEVSPLILPLNSWFYYVKQMAEAQLQKIFFKVDLCMPWNFKDWVQKF